MSRNQAPTVKIVISGQASETELAVISATVHVLAKQQTVPPPQPEKENPWVKTARTEQLMRAHRHSSQAGATAWQR